MFGLLRSQGWCSASLISSFGCNSILLLSVDSYWGFSCNHDVMCTLHHNQRFWQRLLEAAGWNRFQRGCCTKNQQQWLIWLISAVFHAFFTWSNVWPSETSKTWKSDRNGKKGFAFKVKAFETCWPQCWDTTFTMKANHVLELMCLQNLNTPPLWKEWWGGKEGGRGSTVTTGESGATAPSYWCRDARLCV